MNKDILKKLRELSEYFQIESSNTISEFEWVKTNLEDFSTGEPIYSLELTKSDLVKARKIINELFEKISQ